MEGQDKIMDVQPIERPSRKGLILRNGLIFVALQIAIMLVTHFRRDSISDQNMRIAVGMYLLLLVAIVVVQLDARMRVYSGRMDFGQAFSTGMIFVLFVTALFTIFILVFYLTIGKELLAQMITIAENSLRANGTAEADIPERMEFSRKIFTAPGMSIITLIGYLFFGTIMSLIGALFTQRTN